MMRSAPRSETTDHHGASTVGDMTRYVRTLHAAASARATISAATLKGRSARDCAPDGENRKNAQITMPAIGIRTKKATITVAP